MKVILKNTSLVFQKHQIIEENIKFAPGLCMSLSTWKIAPITNRYCTILDISKVSKITFNDTEHYAYELVGVDSSLNKTQNNTAIYESVWINDGSYNSNYAVVMNVFPKSGVTTLATQAIADTLATVEYTDNAYKSVKVEQTINPVFGSRFNYNSETDVLSVSSTANRGIAVGATSNSSCLISAEKGSIIDSAMYYSDDTISTSGNSSNVSQNSTVDLVAIKNKSVAVMLKPSPDASGSFSEDALTSKVYIYKYD